MNRRSYQNITVTFIVLALIALSCKKTMEPVAEDPLQDIPELTAQNFRDLTVTMPNYNTVHFSYNPNKTLWSKDFIGIDFGLESDSGFTKLYSLPGDSEVIAPYYLFFYDVNLRLNPSAIREKVGIRYYKKDSGYLEVQYDIPLYRYPYPSAQIVATKNEIQYISEFNTAVSGQKMFIRFVGISGLFEYDLETHTFKQIVSEYITPYLAANSKYCYYSIHEWSPDELLTVKRYNIQLDKVDFEFTIPKVRRVDGLAADESRLYIKMECYRPTHVYSYDLDFNKLDSLEDKFGGYFMTIDDSVLYFKDPKWTWHPDGEQLIRYDLRAKKRLPNLWAPGTKTEGFSISGDFLYYPDIEKGIIGKVPKADLLEVDHKPVIPVETGQ